jgi:hypothetical protein
MAEWAAFVSAIQSNTAPPIPLDEIIHSTMATLCVQKSLATGARVTVNPLPLDVELTSTLSLTQSR